MQLRIPLCDTDERTYSDKIDIRAITRVFLKEFKVDKESDSKCLKNNECF